MNGPGDFPSPPYQGRFGPGCMAGGRINGCAMTCQIRPIDSEPWRRLSRLALPLVLLALPCLGTQPTENPPLALEDAIRTALQHNLRLAHAGLSVERGRLGVTAALQEFDVSVIPGAGMNMTDGGTEWRSGMRVGKKFPWGSELGIGVETLRSPAFLDEPWRSAVKIDVRQPLFRHSGRLINEEPVTAAGEQLAAERRLWEWQKADLIIDIARQFETITRLEKQILCDETTLARTGQLLELTRAREQQGRASRVDSLRVELQHGQAQSRRENHRDTLFAARRNLAELLGYAPETDLALAPSPLPDLEVPSMEAAVQTALSNRLDYAQSIQDYHAARRGAKIARRRLQPDITLVAGNQQYAQADAFRESTDLDRNLWTVGLAGQTDLNQRRERTAVKVSEVDVQAARQTVAIRAQSIAREVQQGVSAYRQARNELAIAGRNYAAAEARSELARRLFETGRGDSFSVTDAESAFAQSESTLLAARADVCVAAFNLLRLMGTLTEFPPELKPVPLEPAP